jgi:hypothetical protein
MPMNEYYIWLLEQVSAVSLAPYSNYQALLQDLFFIPYTYTNALDKNREIAGLDLRKDFAYSVGIDVSDVRQDPCSVLEMLIGLAKYMSDIYDYTVTKWFWEMIGNMHLDHFYDGHYNSSQVAHTIDEWLQGKYSFRGVGTPFPLRNFSEDTRKMQLFDIMQAYVNENYPVEENWLD